MVQAEDRTGTDPEGGVGETLPRDRTRPCEPEEALPQTRACCTSVCLRIVSTEPFVSYTANEGVGVSFRGARHAAHDPWPSEVKPLSVSLLRTGVLKPRRGTRHTHSEEPTWGATHSRDPTSTPSTR